MDSIGGNNMLKKPRVLVADDHAMMADMLKKLLMPHFEVVGIVKDGLALLRAVEELAPDVVVADIAMPGLSGLEALDRLKQDYPRLKFVILTGYQEPALAQRAIESGASGFVLKMFLSEELTVAVRAALRNETYVTPRLKARLPRLA